MPPIDCRLTKCPTPQEILFSSAVQAAAAALMANTVRDKVEWGAFLFRNADGSIRVGDYIQGTATSVPGLASNLTPSNAVGSLHTHTDLNGPSGRDALLATTTNTNVTVATAAWLYVIKSNGDACCKLAR
jgi:hypothetical protein